MSLFSMLAENISFLLLLCYNLFIRGHRLGQMENKNKKQCSIEVNIHIRLKVTADDSSVLHNLWFTDMNIRVKSGMFGQTAKFGQLPCLFHSSIIGIKIN